MSDDFTLPDDIMEHIADGLLGKTWSEVEVLEHADRLLFPSEIRRRLGDGTFERLPIMLRIPRPPEVRKARLAARATGQKEGLDPILDKGVYSDLETMEILAVAVRNTTDPFEAMFPFGELDKGWDKSSLVQVWRQLEALYQVVDPSPDKIGEMEMLALLAKLAKGIDLGPLVVYGSGAQSYFVTTMARRLLTFMELQLSQESSGDSTPG